MKDHQSTRAHIVSSIADINSMVKPDQRLEGNMIDKYPRQQVLSHATDSHTLDLIRQSNPNNERFQAHLNHTTASGAGSWLHAVPAKALKTDVEPLIYRTMIQCWLRTLIFESELH